MQVQKIMIWLLKIIAALILLQTLYFKFTAHPQSVALFTKIGLEPYGRIGIGVLELIASILLLWPKGSAYGAGLGVGLMSGALFFHLTSLGIEVDGDSILFIYALIVWISCLILMLIYRKDYLDLIQKYMLTKKQTLPLLLITTLLLTSSSCSFSQKNKTMPDSKNKYYSKTDTTKLAISNNEWEKILPAEVYNIAREKGTERAFTGQYWNHSEAGLYRCKACGNALFRSDGKFESSCGWPSFFEPITPQSVKYAEDKTYGMERIEVMCGRCDAHLGHVFDDGPPPTHKRYCINSVIIDFENK